MDGSFEYWEPEYNPEFVYVGLLTMPAGSLSGPLANGLKGSGGGSRWEILSGSIDCSGISESTVDAIHTIIYESSTQIENQETHHDTEETPHEKLLPLQRGIQRTETRENYVLPSLEECYAIR